MRRVTGVGIPRRRKPLVLAIAATAASLLLLASLRCHLAPRGPIVIYLIDTLRPDRLSLYGGPRETSPAATALAREAMTFSNAFSVSSWTRPSVATIFTSTLPSRTTALNRYGRLSESVPTLPMLLKTAGWRTAAFISNGNVFDDRLGFQRGFDSFRRILKEEKPSAREVVDPAVAYIDSQQSPRFFLYVHVIDPHRAYRLEPAYAAKFPGLPASAPERERLLLEYDKTIRQADDQFQRLADALRKRGWWQDALVIYTSDHGEQFYEHGGLGHGSSLYDEQVRVPLILKLPGNEKGGTRRADPVTLADLTPTIADVARVPISQDWIGASLLARMPADRDLYFTEELDGTRVYALRRANRKLIVQLYPTFQRALYDLETDRGESHGTALPCGTPAPATAQDLVRAFQRWRDLDVGAYPGLTLEKVAAVALRLDLTVNLASTPQPFLTEPDYCRFSPRIAGTALEVHRRIDRNESFRLQLASNARGDLPIVRLAVSSSEGDHTRTYDPSRPDSPFRIRKVEARYIRGETTDEVFKHLRALGYLAGGGE